jgi:hypothetical protein
MTGFLGETKRRSISVAFGAMFKRNSGHKDAILESTTNGYRYGFQHCQFLIHIYNCYIIMYIH